MGNIMGLFYKNYKLVLLTSRMRSFFVKCQKVYWQLQNKYQKCAKYCKKDI